MTPSVIALAGPNGAGKSTAGPALVKEALGVTEFVDADVIARGLSAFEPERAAIPAGRIMLQRVKELARRRVSFAFETTLASRSFAPWVRGLLKVGFEFHVVFLWLPSAELAIERVKDRMRVGGHGVPEPTIRRRYHAGLRNFFALYRDLATTWRLYDNSAWAPKPIAEGRGSVVAAVTGRHTWRAICETYENA